MDGNLIIIIIIISISILIGGFILFFCLRRAEKRKDREIIRCIRQQDRIMRELERTRIEKNILFELIKTKLKEAESVSNNSQ